MAHEHHGTPGMDCMDGNTAAGHVAYCMVDNAIIYPITPSSTMGELADAWMAAGRKNYDDQVVQVTEMQSEAGAAGAVHGALSVGALCCTFTASQGLLLMIPNMYKIAGEMMPGVFHVAARAIAGQALSIFGDHSDVMACRQTGWCMLSSHSVQECMDLALVTHLSAFRCSLPFLHFFDGFRTSHEIQKIHVISYDTIKKMMQHPEVQKGIKNHRERALNPTHPHLRGTSQGPDVYFQCVEAANKYYLAVPEICQDVMNEVAKTTGRQYHLFDYCGAKDAENVIVCMGAGSPIMEEIVEMLNKKGKKLGLIKVRLYRPWSSKHFLAALPKTTKIITVLDRTKEPGSFGEPLYLDICGSVQEGKVNVTILGGRYGLGSKEFTPAMALAVAENMYQATPKNHFTVGIDDDLTHSSLPMGPTLDTVPTGTTQCMFWGIGSDGTVGANKEAIKIIGDATELKVQAYFSYDAHKSGGVTVSHLRFGPSEITSQYLIQQADYVACHKHSYIHQFQLLKNVKDGGVFVLNTHMHSLEDLEKELPGSLKRTIAQKKIKFFCIDGLKVAVAAGLGKRINMVMQTVFFKLSQVLPMEEAIKLLKKAIQKQYGRKGEKIVQMNWTAVDNAIAGLVEIKYPASWAQAALEGKHEILGAPEFINNILIPVSRLEGDDLPCSTFDKLKGCVPMGTTAFEKRGIASSVPTWNADKCSQCNYCSYVCPHAAIRPFLVDDEDMASKPASFETRKAQGVQGNMQFRIQVSPFDCTGCSVCANNCPDKALTMTDVNKAAPVENPNWEYAMKLKDHGAMFDTKTIKGSQFQQPLLEFAGACEGCGETPYVKLLTQLFGQRMIISNATGCSSIWGGTFTTNPYTTNKATGKGPAWGNSLFEDNAEYGFGMTRGMVQRRAKFAEKVKAVASKDCCPAALKDVLNNWYENRQNSDKVEKVIPIIEKLLAESKDKCDDCKALYEERDLLPKITHWLIGGDGWAYDIGYGGLDHILASGEKINVLVLDTEVYSNTGGQRSKATPLGAVAKFAMGGNPRPKKDLGCIAMQYEDVYVASVAMGANFNQTLKAFHEADANPGPSIIIAYAPCIAHGTSDMGHFPELQKEAVESGYWSLYRYNPMNKDAPFTLDSRKIKSDLKQFLAKQTRYAQLLREKPEIATKFQENLKAQYNARLEKLKARESLYDSFNKMKQGTGASADANPMLVLFGSETGNASDLAQGLAKMAQKRKFTTRCMAANDFDFDSIENEKLIVFVVSTCGQGEFPANCVDMWKWLNDSARMHEKDKFKNIKFAVFGLGDSHYAQFCKTAVLIDNRMAELGAQRVLPRGTGNDQDEEKYFTGYENWEPELFAALKAPEAPLEEGLPELNFEVKAASADEVKNYKPHELILPAGASALTMTTNKLITPENSDRDVRHYDFDIRGTGLKYNIGDCLAIYGQNKPEDLDAFFAFYKLNPKDVVHVTPKKGNDMVVSVYDLFAQILDIYGRPGRRFYKTLARFATDAKEKERLLFLCSPAGKEEFKKLMAETVTYVDVLKMFPSAHPDVAHLMDLVSPIRPRHYSIASAQSAHPDEIQLVIVLVDWETPSKKKRLGFTTSFLRTQKPGTKVACAVKGAAIELPPSSSTPLVMAGMGTGIAPFRAFLQDRSVAKKAGKPIGPIALYFGCRWKAVDFLYGNELEQYNKDGILTYLRPAFSRDQAKKVYVQNKIEEDAELIYKLFNEQGAYFYMCGPAGKVPEDIRKAIASDFSKVGHMTMEQALAKIDELVAAKRYNVEAY